MQLLKILGQVKGDHPHCPVSGTNESGLNSEILSICHAEFRKGEDKAVMMLPGELAYDADMVRSQEAWYKYVNDLIADKLTDEHVMAFLMSPGVRRFFKGVTLENTVLYSYDYSLISDISISYRIWTLFNLEGVKEQTE